MPEPQKDSLLQSPSFPLHGIREALQSPALLSGGTSSPGPFPIHPACQTCPTPVSAVFTGPHDHAFAALPRPAPSARLPSLPPRYLLCFRGSRSAPLAQPFARCPAAPCLASWRETSPPASSSGKSVLQELPADCLKCEASTVLL